MHFIPLQIAEAVEPTKSTDSMDLNNSDASVEQSGDAIDMSSTYLALVKTDTGNLFNVNFVYIQESHIIFYSSALS